MPAATPSVADVLAAQPDLNRYGWGPGPWPIQVRDFVPPSVASSLAAQAGTGYDHIFTTEQSNESPQHLRIRVSPAWSGVCMVQVQADYNVMCGHVCASQTRAEPGAFFNSLWWDHMLQSHTGAIEMPRNLPVSREAQKHHDLLQRQFVVTGQWRNARFLDEPGRGPPGYGLARIADEYEQKAAVDPHFAAAFGTQFHRRAPGDPPDPQETELGLLLRATGALDHRW